jgi:hypothetical protein
MQTLLCLVIFLVTTSRLTSAYTYLGIACTSALRLGLHKDVAKELSSSEAQEEARHRVMLAVLQLDTTVSVVLDMPARINPDDLDQVVLSALQLPATKKTSNTPEAIPEAQAKFAAAAKHLHILSLTAGGFRGIFAHSGLKEKTTREVEIIDTKKMVETEGAFRKWAKALGTLPIVATRPEMSAV